jgi:hypothetical protein
VFDVEDGIPTWDIRVASFVRIEEPRWLGESAWVQVFGDPPESMDFEYGCRPEMVHTSRADAIRSLRGQLADHRAKVTQAIDEAERQLERAEVNP